MIKNKITIRLLIIGYTITTIVILLPGYKLSNKNFSFKASAVHAQYKIPDNAFKSLEKKLKSAGQTTPDGKVSYKKFYLTQEELNAYIQINYGHKFPPEIKAWQIRLNGDEALILVLIDLDEFREALRGELTPLAQMLLHGEITLRCWGEFYGHNAIGKFIIRGLRLGFLPIPIGLLKRMIISKSSEEDAAVLDKGFPLPEGFRSAKIAGSYIIIN